MMIIVLMGITFLLTIADIAVKFYIESNVARGEEHSMLDGRVIIRKVYNKGMALNKFDDHEEEVKIVSVFATVILTIYQMFWLMHKKHFFRKAGLSLMVAGAWSNTFDRWVRGYVVDYVGFRTKWKKFTDITFNMGDFCIIGGCILYMLTKIFQRKRK